MNTISNLSLKLRLILAPIILFGILYLIVALILGYLGIGTYLAYGGVVLILLLIQFLIGPKLVERQMHVHYVSEQEAPKLHAIIEDLAMKAGVPKPRVGIAEIDVPNAFAFGKSKGDGRICVTRGILKLLDKEELEAVLGHEMSHIKHNDMIVMTLVSAVPIICYMIALSFLFSGEGGNNNGGYGFIIGAGAFGAYILGQLLVLFISRSREYYADQGSVDLGGRPHKLASALYKLVYGSATASEESIKEVSGLKAFFVNDISDAGNEINDLQQLDVNNDGVISEEELARLRYSDTKVGTGQSLMELLSTHPNMIKRVKRLSELA
jgi:heat shock protein HtpX